MSNAYDRSALKWTAKALRQELHIGLRRGIRLRPRIKMETSGTDGWRVELAGLGRGEPRLELWLDHWADPDKRRFWYGLYAAQPSKLQVLVKKLPDYLQPKRCFTDRDMRVDGGTYRLKIPLDSKEFGPPFIEKYKEEGTAFYGKFSSAAAQNKKDMRLMVRKAAAFFEDVVRSWQPKADQNNERDYSHEENRRVVRQHLARERSRVLADACKRRDGYRCKVCDITFEEKYGAIGREFAEAHHLVPLSRLSNIVKTSLEDMITVCPNCHRMLHKMDGKSGNVAKLKRMMK